MPRRRHPYLIPPIRRAYIAAKLLLEAGPCGRVTSVIFGTVPEILPLTLKLMVAVCAGLRAVQQPLHAAHPDHKAAELHWLGAQHQLSRCEQQRPVRAGRRHNPELRPAIYRCVALWSGFQGPGPGPGQGMGQSRSASLHAVLESKQDI